MLWKVVGGIAAFILVVVLAVTLLATAGVAAVGIAVGSIVEDLDISTVQVTDAGGNTETYDVEELISESGRLEVTGDNGERVTIDFEVPQITIQDSGEEAARVVIDGGSGLKNNPDMPQIRIDGHNFDGDIFARPFASLLRGLSNLVICTLVLAGIWLVLRKRQPETNEPKEKSPNATA